jgi:hypothetical protein
MSWEDIKNRKEDSIRESTNNPVKKSFELNGKTYNSFTDFLNSDEYNESLNQLVSTTKLYEIMRVELSIMHYFGKCCHLKNKKYKVIF